MGAASPVADRPLVGYTEFSSGIMSIRAEHQPSDSIIRFLIRCYRFINEEWRRAAREQLPDQGFEMRFRESCVRELHGWSTSEQREMGLGGNLGTASGVLHEIDLVATYSGTMAIVEIKNRPSSPPDKNDVIIFFAKVLDYLARNPRLASEEVALVFMSSGSFEPSGLAACSGLGIHPVGANIRPLPVLVHTARVMESELREGLAVSSHTRIRFDDLCAQLNQLSLDLSETWLSTRCSYLSEDEISIKAAGPRQTSELAERLRQANSDCADILRTFRIAAGLER